MQIDPAELVSGDATAERCHVKPQTLAQWRSEGRGPRYLKIGRRVFYREQDIREFLGEQLCDPAERIRKDGSKPKRRVHRTQDRAAV
jgi:predicted DNA-binding transcriptional regulator AlpA